MDMTFTIRAVQSSTVFPRFLPAAAGLTVISAMAGSPAALAQGSLFTAVPVDEANFILVSAPIGNGERSQLNIYEQRSSKRPCYAVSGNSPAIVDPLLSTFDFTGICNRYIDGNGYSLRIGGDDLGTRYRLSVVKTASDIELLAAPTRNQSRPSFVVARSGGSGSGFVQFNFEPGWKLMRRAYGKKQLGHIYIYRDSSVVESESPSAEEAPMPVIDTPKSDLLPASNSTKTRSSTLLLRKPSSAQVDRTSSYDAVADSSDNQGWDWDEWDE